MSGIELWSFVNDTGEAVKRYRDVIRFTRPPRIVQRTLFRALAPLARLRGYRGRYARSSAEWLEARSRESIAREAVRSGVEAAGVR